VVLSTLGGSNLLKRNPSLTVGVRNIVRAMESTGVLRFIYESALEVVDSVADTSFFVRYFILPVIQGRTNADHEENEQTIKASNLNWVIVRLQCSPINREQENTNPVYMLRTRSIGQNRTGRCCRIYAQTSYRRQVLAFVTVWNPSF